MKNLQDISEPEAKEICRLAGEPFLDFMTNKHGKWTSMGLEVSINTTSTLYGDPDDSQISIYKNGKIILHRNNGDWGGSRYEEINTLPIIDYLRERGYNFT
jgi:hypothetical protein